MSLQEKDPFSVQPMVESIKMTESLRRLKNILMPIIVALTLPALTFVCWVLLFTKFKLFNSPPIGEEAFRLCIGGLFLISELIMFAVSLRIIFGIHISRGAKFFAVALFASVSFIFAYIFGAVWIKNLGISESIVSNLFRGTFCLQLISIPACLLLLSIGIRKMSTNVLFYLSLVVSLFFTTSFPEITKNIDAKSYTVIFLVIVFIYWVTMVVGALVLWLDIRQKLKNGDFTFDHSPIEIFQLNMARLKNLLAVLICLTLLMLCNLVLGKYYGPWRSIIGSNQTALWIIFCMLLCSLPNISRGVKFCAGVLFVSLIFTMIQIIFSPLVNELLNSENRKSILFIFSMQSCIDFALLSTCMLLLSIGFKKTMTNVLFFLLLLLSCYMCYRSWCNPRLNQAILISEQIMMLVGAVALYVFAKQKIKNAPDQLSSGQSAFEQN